MLHHNHNYASVLRMPIASFFIILVITFTLFLPAGFYVAWKNISALSDIWNQSAEISLYLKKNVNPKTASELAGQLKSNSVIMDLKLITPDEGMKDFAKRTGFGEILLGFKENPLPQVIIIYPKLSESTEEQVKALVDELKNIPTIEAVKIDMDWVERSYRLLNLLEYLSFVLGLLLSVGALVMFCFVTYVAPKVIQQQCFWHSLIGGVFAISLVNLILMKLHDFGFDFQGLGAGYSIVFILSAALLGIISSKFAMRKHV